VFPQHIATGGSQPPSPAAAQLSTPTQDQADTLVEQIATIGVTYCLTCGQRADPELRWKRGRRGVLHLGLYCRRCGRWIKWVPQTPAVLRVAPTKLVVRIGDARLNGATFGWKPIELRAGDNMEGLQ
jgi:hypothetical protein